MSLISSEHDEGLSNVTFNSLLLDSEHVESDSLGDWSALAYSNDITNSGSLEHWWKMSGQVVMSLLEPVVLLDVMQVISSQNDGSVHLVWENDTPNGNNKIRKSNENFDLLEDSSSDGHIGSEWALLINIGSIFSFLWGLETWIN